MQKVKVTNAQRELIAVIHAQYAQPNGKIHWKQAFAEHPEWAKELGIPKKLPRIYAIKNRMRRSGLLGSPKSPVAASHTPAVPGMALLRAIVPMGTPAPVYTDGVPHCPECGCSLASWNRAYNAMRNTR
jgi:hypothetical protein